ncbi:hypothetical protein RR48_00742 [Papilio machaon]|uniref:TERF2-interacting telomeric protein 1 Myb domain-containing protein n=1 Tax=Papilio machaon TaxID=76193 RepID=A0A0N0PFM6_PAPMA|nr:hypothetical protein RR48_00742 [Papilio machaon]
MWILLPIQITIQLSRSFYRYNSPKTLTKCGRLMRPRVNGLRVTSSPAKAPIEASKPTGTKAPTGARTSGTKSVGAKRVSGWESRVYSPLEDQAIISWVQLGGRARLVNGNRLWRELQPHHLATTGVSRSWHSLRNRYLRYILPTLSNLAPTPVAVHLRAAAATGEIKNRKQKKPVNNSMFAMPRVRSAFAPRRARLASSHTPSPPARPPRTPSPVKRKAMATSTSTASRSPSPSPSPTPSPVPTERSRLSKRYSELRRRFKDVEESSDEAPRVLRPRPSQVPRRSMHDSSRVLRQEPKKRRLYNPEVI